MKKIYTSALTAALLSTSAFAASPSIKDAFANGTVSGDISLYGTSTSANAGNADSGFTMGSIGLQYETDSFNGFKAAIGGRTNHMFSEKEEGDYRNSFDDTEGFEDSEAALNTANISYTADMGALTIGRQEIDLEWIGDYHEAVVAAITAVPDTQIVLGHTTRTMATDADTALGQMTDIGDNGATVLDVKYSGIQDVEINPYFMNANDLMKAYGLKATASISGVDLIAHYAMTSEDAAGIDDGSIAHLEVGTTVENISLAAGYITTDKDGGSGNISELGDNIDPSEDLGDYIYGKKLDENIYAVNTDTFYVSIGTEVDIVSLSAQYAAVEYDSVNKKDNTLSKGDKASEILLTAGVAITGELGFEVSYASLDAENSDDDTDKVFGALTYSF